MSKFITINYSAFNSFCEVDTPCRFRLLTLDEEITKNAVFIEAGGYKEDGVIVETYLWADFDSRTAKWLSRDQHEAQKARQSAN